MKFISGSSLTIAMKTLVRTRGKLDAAVAYWGNGSLSLLGLNPKRKDVRIICCLKGGKSDPAVIARFRKRARQNDRLHAKVFLTPHAAIVGSANASSNGLPEEEDKLAGLIEAGVYVEDAATIGRISEWFEREFKKARAVTKKDLKDAKEARDARMWGASNKKVKKRSLIDAIASGKQEFLQQKIYFMLFGSHITDARSKAAILWAKNNEAKIKKHLVAPDLRWDWLDFYQDWPKFPSNAHLIDVFYTKKSSAVSGPTKTFHSRVYWDGLEYVLKAKKVDLGIPLRTATNELSNALQRNYGLLPTKETDEAFCRSR